MLNFRWEPYDPTRVYQQNENKLDFTTKTTSVFQPAEEKVKVVFLYLQ